MSQSGSIGLVGASADDIGANSDQGSAYVFRNLNAATGTITENVKLTSSDGTASDQFGFAVFLDGDQFVIGAYVKNSNTGKAYSGSVSSVTTLDAGSTSKTISGISFVSQDDWIIGETTDGNQVTLSAGDTASVTAAGNAVFIGKDAGSDNNTLVVAGKVTATQVTISAASGSTGNSVEVTTTGLLAATNITVNSGGTLLLSGTGSTDRIGNATGVTLVGGKLAFSGNVTEGPSSPGTGALTLSADSIIDFGGGNDVINFGASGSGNPNPWIGGTTLSIWNWSGSSSGGGNDHLLFGSASNALSLTSGQLAQISFYTGSGTGFLGTGMFAGSSGEVVPVPEPSFAMLGLAMMGLACWRERRLSQIRRSAERI